jgi:hypothetical protein
LLRAAGGDGQNNGADGEDQLFVHNAIECILTQ